MSEPLSQEILDRVRRIETRLTKFLEASGFDTQVQRPGFTPDGFLVIPTPSVSLRDCLEAIPREWYGKRVVVRHKGENLAVIVR